MEFCFSAVGGSSPGFALFSMHSSGRHNRFQLSNPPASTLANFRTSPLHRISAFPYSILMRFALSRFILEMFP